MEFLNTDFADAFWQVMTALVPLFGAAIVLWCVIAIIADLLR